MFPLNINIQREDILAVKISMHFTAITFLKNVNFQKQCPENQCPVFLNSSSLMFVISISDYLRQLAILSGLYM